MDDPLDLLADAVATGLRLEDVAQIVGPNTNYHDLLVDAIAAGVDLSAELRPMPVRPRMPSLILNTDVAATRIQTAFRGFICRAKRLPLIFYKIAAHLKNVSIIFSTTTTDGRINSSLDESSIVECLVGKFGDRIKKSKDRHWNDISVFDTTYGWLPVNIKSTTMKTSDNTGNMAVCVHAYTDETLDLEQSYQNGPMSKILVQKIRNRAYNRSLKKDYYFIVLNKEKPGDVIVNSVRGLTKLTPNLNNLPFQVKWDENRVYHYRNIRESVKQFVEVLRKPKMSWSEEFMGAIRGIDI